MKKIEQKDKPVLLGLLGLITYIIYYVLNIILGSLDMNIIDYLFASTLISVLVVAIIIKLNKDQIKTEFIDFKKNSKEYFNKYFKYYLFGLFAMFGFNILNSYIFDIGNTTNEETIRAAIDVFPVYIFITAVIIGPIQEELVFRFSFNKAIRNKIAFIIISSLLFSYMHTTSDMNSLIDLLYLLPYLPLGISFAYILVKSKNIFTTIAFHTLHNGVLVSLQILLLVLSWKKY